MVLADGLLASMTDGQWDAANAIKQQGAHNLDMATREQQNIDAFVMFSSISSLFGNPGQANYAHGNAAAETVARTHAVALPDRRSLAIQWGMIGNVGAIAADAVGVNAVLASMYAPQHIDDCLRALDYMLAETGVQGATTCACYLRATSSNDVEEEVTLVSTGAFVASLLGTDVDVHVGLGKYGLDSLSSVELVGWINRRAVVSVPMSFVSSETTIAQVYAAVGGAK